MNAAAQSKKQIDTAKLNARKARVEATYLRYEQAKFIGKVNFLSILDPEAPTIQPSVEIAFSKRVSAEFAFGIPVKIHGNVRNTDSTYYRYYKFKAEIRYFPSKRKDFFIGPEISYISKERSDFNDFFYARDGHTYEYDFAEIDKSIVALAFKVGVVTPFRKNNRWLLEISAGAGTRFIHMKINTVNRRPGGPRFFPITSDYEGSRNAVHGTMAIKIGYVIF